MDKALQGGTVKSADKKWNHKEQRQQKIPFLIPVQFDQQGWNKIIYCYHGHKPEMRQMRASQIEQNALDQNRIGIKIFAYMSPSWDLNEKGKNDNCREWNNDIR